MFICGSCEKRCRRSVASLPRENGSVDCSSAPVQEETGEPAKKPKLEPIHCSLCLGVLNPDSIDAVISDAFRLLHDYEWKSLCFTVTTPLAILPREAAFNARGKLDEQGWKSPKDLKDTWKALLSARLDAAKKIVRLVRSQDDDPGTACVAVEYSFEADEAECERVRMLDPMMKTNGKVHGRKYSQRLLTRAYVQSVLDGAKAAEVLSVSQLPVRVTSPATVARVEVSRPSYWIAGRYLKYSRTLCQTPWVIDGVRKGETSLEELIQGGIKKIIACDDVRFSSSGREDVDVRCLGNGRPFLCQITNPRKLCNGDGATAIAVRNAINEGASGQISVRDVQFVSKSDTATLKEGEEEKVKRYRALCRTSEPIPGEKLAALASMPAVVARQKTPIRVLHRRSLAVRERTVHSMSAELCPGHDGLFFELRLETQAGTYVKEFVHGDLGRTVPNMSKILGVPVDIVALDVEAVMLDWPPYLDPIM